LPDKNVFYFNQNLLVYILTRGGISPSLAALIWNAFATEKWNWEVWLFGVGVGNV